MQFDVRVMRLLLINICCSIIKRPDIYTMLFIVFYLCNARAWTNQIQSRFTIMFHQPSTYFKNTHIHTHTRAITERKKERKKELFTLLCSHQWDANNKTKFVLYLCWWWWDSIFFHYIVQFGARLLSRLILIKKCQKVFDSCLQCIPRCVVQF